MIRRTVLPVLKGRSGFVRVEPDRHLDRSAAGMTVHGGTRDEGRRIQPAGRASPGRERPAVAYPPRSHAVLRLRGSVHRELCRRDPRVHARHAQDHARRASRTATGSGGRTRTASWSKPTLTGREPGRACRRSSTSGPATGTTTLAVLAWRLLGELRPGDTAAPLAIEGLLLEILAGAARERELRLTARCPDGSPRPASYLHDPGQVGEPRRARDGGGRASRDACQRVPEGVRLQRGRLSAMAPRRARRPTARGNRRAARGDRAGSGLRGPEPLLQRVPAGNRGVRPRRSAEPYARGRSSRLPSPLGPRSAPAQRSTSAPSPRPEYRNASRAIRRHPSRRMIAWGDAGARRCARRARARAAGA